MCAEGSDETLVYLAPAGRHVYSNFVYRNLPTHRSAILTDFLARLRNQRGSY